jgi:RimJ/RimL family protein N-acetyltransferase
MEIKFEKEIVGRHIVLRKITINDAQDIYTWRSSISGKYMRHPKDYSLISQEEWIKSRGANEINYIIFDKNSNEKVGTIGIYDVNDIDKIANVGRLILCGEYLGKSNPYGLEALLLNYNYVLNVMGYRKITGDILATNEAMFRLQKFLGMKEEGYLEKHVIIHGEPLDIYIMSIFKDEFNNIYRKKIEFLLKNFN